MAGMAPVFASRMRMDFGDQDMQVFANNFLYGAGEADRLLYEIWNEGAIIVDDDDNGDSRVESSKQSVQCRYPEYIQLEIKRWLFKLAR